MTRRPWLQPGAWPPRLKPLADRCGAEALYFAGVEVLGHPPTWITRPSRDEIRALEGALLKRQGA